LKRFGGLLAYNTSTRAPGGFFVAIAGQELFFPSSALTTMSAKPKASIPLGGSADDAHFRYKRDPIAVRHEAKHGGQTRLENLDRVCKQLGAERAAVCKFVQKHLGCPRVGSDGVIRQHVTAAQLEAALVAFTTKHVLCATCHLPELDPDGTCRACGATTKHKADKKKKKKKNASARAATDATVSPEPSDEDEVAGLDATMKHLYAMRDGASAAELATIDSLLDECWSCSTDEALAAIQATMVKAQLLPPPLPSS
jgi:translation initiation factor 2 beta subunit (eIF-2beta)/eIF-5